MKNIFNFIPAGWFTCQFYFNKSKSSSSSSSNKTTTTTTRAQSAALENIDVEGGDFLNAVDSKVTINNADSVEFLGQAQAFLGETFSTALNFVDEQSSQAFEVAAGRPLDAAEPSEDTNLTPVVIGTIALAGLIAYKVLD